jgi:arylsulfatase A-like enzyme
MEDVKRWRRMAAERISRRTLLKSAAAGAIGLAAACSGDEKTPGTDTASSGLTTPEPKSPRVAASGSTGGVAANAIIIVMDTFRADHIGIYGNDWIETPSLDALASESITFTHAFPEILTTIPMRRTLHTGLRTWPVRQWVQDKGDIIPTWGWQRIPEDQTTVAETLAVQGYQTGFITDTYHYFSPSRNFHRGFNQWVWVRGQEMDRLRSTLNIDLEQVKAMIPPNLPEGEAYLRMVTVSQHLANQADRKKEEDYQAPRVFREALRWLEDNLKAEKFFLLVDVFDPHEPWDPPDEYVKLYADPDYDGLDIIDPRYGSSDNLTQGELDRMRARYAGEVTMVDRWLGRFLDGARELGMLEDTLVVVTSDHGHQLGEHGLTGKVARGLWYELVDVPLIVRRPDGVDVGKRVESFVQHHDIAPTVLAALGVAPLAPLTGVNLLELAADRIQPREHVSCGYNEFSWCRDGRYVYITRNDGTDQQLFDMENDPLQMRNLAADHQTLMWALHQKLLEDAGGPLPML